MKNNFRPALSIDDYNLSIKHAVRCNCFTLDNEVSEIMLTIPRYTSWMEPMEVAAVKIEEIVKYLTSSFTAFKAYQIEIGTIDPDRGFKSTIKYPVKQFPIQEDQQGDYTNVYNPAQRKETRFLTTDKSVMWKITN